MEVIFLTDPTKDAMFLADLKTKGFKYGARVNKIMVCAYKSDLMYNQMVRKAQELKQLNFHGELNESNIQNLVK
jgi:hypothetical protein